MKIETGTKFEVEIEGLTTVMDFVEDRFIFLVKDELLERCGACRWRGPCRWKIDLSLPL